MVKLLDLFCGEGGAGMGYHQAGFEVFGVDLNPNRYPFPSHTGDAIEFVERYGHEFDVIHASPPCHSYSRGTRGLARKYPNLIRTTREALQATGRPYIIENVKDAPLRSPVELCGCMFDITAYDLDGVLLHLRRARLFESNMPLTKPRHHNHEGQEWIGGVYDGARRDKYEARAARRGYRPPKSVQEELMGIDWMTQKGLYQAIPPIYTKYLGEQVIKYLEEQ